MQQFDTGPLPDNYKKLVHNAGTTLEELTEKVGVNYIVLSRLLNGHGDFTARRARANFLEPLEELYREGLITIQDINNRLKEASNARLLGIPEGAKESLINSLNKREGKVKRLYGPLDRENGEVDARILDLLDKRRQRCFTAVVRNVEPFPSKSAMERPLVGEVKTSANRPNGALLTPEGVLLNPSTGSCQDLDLADREKELISPLSSGELRRQQSTIRKSLKRKSQHRKEVTLFTKLLILYMRCSSTAVLDKKGATSFLAGLMYGGVFGTYTGLIWIIAHAHTMEAVKKSIRFFFKEGDYTLKSRK